jgi:hypothetical protein
MGRGAWFRKNPIYGSLAAVKVDLLIRSGDEIIYQGDSVLSKLFTEPMPASGQLRVTFDYIPMNVEHLDFSFSFLDPITSEVHDWKRNLRLQVARQSLHQGRLFIPSRWELFKPRRVVTPAVRERAG